MQVLTTAPWRWEEVNGRRARGTCSARRAPEGGLEGGARVRGGGGVLDGNQRRAQDRLLHALPIKRPAQVGFTLVVAPSWAQPYNLRHAPKPTGPRTCGERARRAEHLHAHVRDCDTRPSRPTRLPVGSARAVLSTCMRTRALTRARADRPAYLEPLPSPPCRRAAPPAAASGPCRPAAHQTEQNASASGNA